MKKLSLALAHCYGIRNLETVLDFSRSSTVAIYAPNGAMKSSLANTFDDIANGRTPKDRIFTARETKCAIRDEENKELAPGSILVIRPYEDVTTLDRETATLLVNRPLREEYEALHAEINTAKSNFIKAIKAQARTKCEVDQEISSVFAATPDQFELALRQVRDKLTEQESTPFSDVPYDLVMDEKVVAFLATGDFRVAIDDYVKKYNELLGESKYFKKGRFNYYNAANVAKELKGNGFFDANHAVRLNGDEELEITSEAQLSELIKKEKEKITQDVDLRKKFDALEKQIQKNATLREFEAYLQNHEELLPELADLSAFRKKLWRSYIKANYGLYIVLLEKLELANVRAQEIRTQASIEKTLWESVIEIFNDRFLVPFKLEIANKVQVMLGVEPAPRLGFVFTDQREEVAIGRDALLQTLSTGERRAFYVLNMLFEIEVRRQSGQETLVVIDDIADSFDYKNKYAIVQYLCDLAEDRLFKLLILTHNFDFYRTIESRKLVQRSNCFMVSKTAEGIALESAVGVKNVFVKLWKPHFHESRKMKICCIPFMRNLIEYTRGEEDPDFLMLTSLLHWKPDSSRITVAHLDQIYGRLFASEEQSANGKQQILELIDEEAKACLQAADGINFENKVVLAIATRLQAEKHMAGKIADPIWLDGINANQTPSLLIKYRELFPGEVDKLRILQKVALMTPENIHLNSFMYEPILDMSDEHLRRLYTKVVDLI
ncbi:phage infection protein [Herbaspirillum huttiense F1]|uniref:phage infection protein n=1 Tax=Herbaspirillum huttiense TaxID=863372 RepID=UPI0028883C9B|nr:phage infection protein [Herbaspirillum huttiense]MDT0354765.1 phage infection protein [Herbaspirillum huttiense F1]